MANRRGTQRQSLRVPNLSLSLTPPAGSPICIGPLFVPNSNNATGAGPLQSMPSRAPAPSGGDVGVLEGSGGGQVGHTGTSNWRLWQSWKTKTLKASAKSSDDDILTLKSCQHAFHAKCLSSWFLIDRYDCPVCRSHYWQTRETRARAATAPPRPVSGATDDSGIQRPAPARLVVERLTVPIM